MQILKQPYAFTRNERWTLLLLAGGVSFALLAAHVPLALSLAPACPVHELLGLDCPGCGLTRASLALARLDLVSALLFNPLIFLIAPYVLYRTLAIAVGAVSGRRLVARWPAWFLDRYQLVFVALFLCIGSSRLLAWVALQLPASL